MFFESQEPLVRVTPEPLRLPGKPAPLEPVFEWASNAWKEHAGGVVVLVPAEAIRELLQRAAGR